MRVQRRRRIATPALPNPLLAGFYGVQAVLETLQGFRASQIHWRPSSSQPPGFRCETWGVLAEDLCMSHDFSSPEQNLQFDRVARPEYE